VPISLHQLTFAWPDGHALLHDVTFEVPAGRSSLIGRNGAGKSTLLRLITGELTPTSGTITRSGEVTVLPQHPWLNPDAPVTDLLGVTTKLDALDRIEAGEYAPELFDTVGDDWDLAERLTAQLDRLGMAALLHRRLGEVSGGEARILALVGVQLRRAALTLLDEPTNDLDARHRAQVHDLVTAWRGDLLVVSHDLELLDLVDHTVELRGGRLRTFGGGYQAWQAATAAEQQAAAKQLAAAKQRLQRERDDAAQQEQAMATRRAAGRAARANATAPKIVLNAWKNSAEQSTGRLREQAKAKIADAQEAVRDAEDRLRDDDAMPLTLPDPGLSHGRRVATFSANDRDRVLQGPERWAIVGPNGVGKSTLLRRLVGAVTGETHEGLSEPDRPTATSHVERIGYLPQRPDVDLHGSALDLLTAAAPGKPVSELRNGLGRFLIQGDTALRPLHTLSGGERFRAVLASLLLADPGPQLLVLDEPTNDIDLDTKAHLVRMLQQYRGAVVIVSHEPAFLRQLTLDRVLAVTASGLTDIGTP